MATRINFIDLYSFYDDIDSYVIESLMDGSNVSFSIRSLGADRSSGAWSPDEKRIAVEEDKVELARKLLGRAIRSGAISREGRFRD
ncbi:MAG: hypothetical protein ACE5EI_05285 [Thermodesulfobacteriota bacterium]